MVRKEYNPTNPNFTLWRNLLWILLIWLLFSFVLNIFRPPADKRQISYTEFKKNVRMEKVSEVTLKGKTITGKFKVQTASNGSRKKNVDDIAATNALFTTIMPEIEDPDLLPLLEHKNVVVNVQSTERPWLWRLVINLLPWLLIFGFFVYSSRKFQQRMGGKGGIFGFSSSKAKLYEKSKSDVGYHDVAGLDNAKKELQEIVDFLKTPSKFQDLGGELPKGILLVGPPGVGKTLLAQATAGEADTPFYSITGSEFIEMFVGVGASRVRDMFKKAKKSSPAIIFIDEIDSIGRVRGTGVGGGHDEREQTLNQILSEMDGFSHHESVVVIAATNRPDVLDPALTRPGRFDRKIVLDLPQKNARKQILEIHTKHVPITEDVNLDRLAARTVGFSGADLKNLVNEAILTAARKDREQVQKEDFERARDKIILGIEREDAIKDEEKRMIAYHEAGHALVAVFYPGADPLEKVSIIPRGHSLGATELIPEEDRHNLSRSYLLGRIAVMLGGRAAENIVYDDITSGAGDDLKKVTQLARRMVCQWGMSRKLGAITFRHGEPHPFLGLEMASQKDYSEETARIIDEEVRKIVQDMENKAIGILRTHKDELHTLAQGLLENESLSKEKIDQLLSLNTGDGKGDDEKANSNEA
jgi:cell division protease FtsH